jgi:transcriptional regulator with XRE-family HTH domain
MTTDKPLTIVDLIQQLTAEHGNRNNLSKAMGVSNATLISWEKGINTPNRDSLIRLASLTGYTINELLGMVDPTIEPPNVERILVEIAKLSREDIARVIRKATDLLLEE